ncbi:MAG: hypothetical protein SFU98_13710 [Leptospiraceae bacterium]|nr:hypothetical protein [Leptospiraceae bacterium]
MMIIAKESRVNIDLILENILIAIFFMLYLVSIVLLLKKNRLFILFLIGCFISNYFFFPIFSESTSQKNLSKFEMIFELPSLFRNNIFIQFNNRYLNRKRFNQTLWLSQRIDSENYERLSMVDDLLINQNLKGKNIEEIEKILGLPDCNGIDEGFRNKDTWFHSSDSIYKITGCDFMSLKNHYVYFLGYEKTSFGLLSDSSIAFLILEISNGIVIDTKLKVRSID